MATLYVCGITNMSVSPIPTIDHKFFIARSVKNPDSILRCGFSLMSDLAPTRELLYGYLDLKRQGRWNQQAFDEWYTPRFIHQMYNYNPTRGNLNFIYKLLTNGKDVALACYCHDKNMCHRTLIGKEFEKLGFKVVYM